MVEVYKAAEMPLFLCREVGKLKKFCIFAPLMFAPLTREDIYGLYRETANVIPRRGELRGFFMPHNLGCCETY